jgi:hypothetical protein
MKSKENGEVETPGAFSGGPGVPTPTRGLINNGLIALKTIVLPL